MAVAALGSTMFLPAARAADNSRAPADNTDQPAYRKAIEEGLAEYDARHFEEARSFFRHAHEISPNARTFRGIGMTSFELRDYVSAVRNLTAALQDKRKPLSADQRKHTQELLDRSRMFVDVYKLTVSPKNARLIVDGHAPEFEPDGTLLFSFGTHTLEASAHGMAVRSFPISVRGGERKELSLTLDRAAPPAATRPPDAKTDPFATATKSAPLGESNAAAAAWLWASGGTALAAAGAGIYWLYQNSYLNTCQNHGGGCSNTSTIKTYWDLGLGLTVGAGPVAMTMAFIGILSWDYGPPVAKKQSALNCTVSPFGMACGGSF